MLLLEGGKTAELKASSIQLFCLPQEAARILKFIFFLVAFAWRSSPKSLMKRWNYENKYKLEHYLQLFHYLKSKHLPIIHRDLQDLARGDFRFAHIPYSFHCLLARWPAIPLQHTLQNPISATSHMYKWFICMYICIYIYENM